MPNPLNEPTPFIGVGPGRCGSHTLYEIIKVCKRVRCVHEAVQIPWYDGGSSESLGELIRRFREDSRSGVMSGEIGPCLVRQIPHLRSSFPELKVVCLHRSKHEVVRSFLEYGKSMPPVRPVERERWADGCLGPDKWDAGVPKCFPVIDAATREQSIGFWWEYYEALMADVRPPVHHLNTQQLNDPEAVRGLFDFLEIPECDRVFIEVRRFWSMDDVREKWRNFYERRPHA